MKQNDQAPEKRVLDFNGRLAVNSVFHTIQGEGPFAGVPSVFVRLAGCNLQCPLCDTAYTARGNFTIDEIVHTIKGAAPSGSRVPKLVVITGGEPLRQPIGDFVRRLLDMGFTVQLETNGTLIQPGVPYWHAALTVVCSPKTATVHRLLVPHVDAWKYVATDRNIDPLDGLPVYALDHPTNGKLFRPPVGHRGDIYLQPVDEQDPTLNQRNQDAVVQACLKFGHRLCLQIHKTIGVD